MKKTVALFFLGAALLFAGSSQAQNADKSKRPSPPAKVSQKIASGATISIDYSQPSLKGRTIGKDVEPMKGQMWRAGANEATVFETDKPIKVEGKELPAGKYALFMMPGDDEYTVIFNSVWNTWGAYDYEKNKDKDVLKVKVKPGKATSSSEKLTYVLTPDGNVILQWGTLLVGFMVQ